MPPESCEQDRVEPVTGEIFRYFVKSWNGPNTYLVDLAEEEFQGVCSCPHHQIRIQKIRLEGKKARCKHVRAAIEYAWPLFGKAVLQQQERLRRQKA